MRTMALVQVRMGSTRLPGKAMADLGGRPLLDVLLDRLERARSLDGIALATTDLPRDDVLAALGEARGLPVVRGSEEDPLDRFHKAAQVLDIDVVVRITGDCPLIDPELVDELVALRAARGVPYAAILTAPIPGFTHYPDGLDAEAFTAEALALAWREATAREHITTYIKDHLPLAWLTPAADMLGQRWTVDTPEDLAFVRGVVDALGPAATTEEILALVANRTPLQEPPRRRR